MFNFISKFIGIASEDRTHYFCVEGKTRQP